MMTQIRFSIPFAVLLLALGAGCSSSRTAEGGDDAAATDIANAADAGTDEVPAPPAEESAPADQNVAKAEEAPAEQPPPPAEQATPPAAQPQQEQVAAVPPPAPVLAGESSQYTVQPGDTLMKIAFETYGDLYQWHRIYDLNREHIPDANNVAPGTVLQLEKPSSPIQIERNGDRYLIKKGDTLGSISNEVYGDRGQWRKLYENNRQLIRDPNRIFAGFYLYYTGGQAPQAAPPPLTQNEPAAAPAAQEEPRQPASAPEAIPPPPAATTAVSQ